MEATPFAPSVGDDRLFDTLVRLLGIASPELRPALDQASNLVAAALGADVEHILRRLNLRSRTQIGVWAVERGLYRSDQENGSPNGRP